MTTEHSPFPSDETLAAFVDGKLDEEARQEVVEHMAHCTECRDVVFDASDLKTEGVLSADDESELAQVLRPWWKRRWREAAAALVAAAAVIVVVLFVRPPQPEIAKLAKVAPPERYGEGRLVGFHYAPHLSPNRGGGDKFEDKFEDKPENLPFLKVASEVEEKAAEHPTAESLHAEGVELLVRHKHTEAVQALSKALQFETHQSDIDAAVQASKDPQLLSDLAAAEIASGRYAEALTAAERAWSLSKSKSPEAAWNRAMAAQRLEHRNQAIAYWHDYLQLDPESQWASEARKKLKELETP